MKKVLIILSLIFAIQANAIQHCSCGSFETGIYEYNIVENTGGCCSGFPAGVNDKNEAYLVTYTLNEGVWEMREITGVNPETAQTRCCPNNS
ncbi:MAG: hypothetical protein ACQESK_01555 [Bacteroidota bacterium]